MRFPDETLIAYADGELDAVARAEIEAAMATDPQLARAVERHRSLRARLQVAYAGVLEEPVPAHLGELAMTAAAAQTDELAARRAAKAEVTVTQGRRGLPYWATMAASLALGLFVGVFMLRGSGSPYEETVAGLLARGELAKALDNQLASESATGTVRVGMSFRDRRGSYCRTFQSQLQAPVAGLACQTGEAWRIQVLAATAMPEGELRTAGAMPMAVLQAVDAAMVGDPLDAAAERTARDDGWRAGVHRD